jgi:hypothetical protein
MDFEASWQQLQELNEEPALQSTGWDTEMQMLPTPTASESAGSISVPLASPLEAVMAIPVPAAKSPSPAPTPAPKSTNSKPAKAELHDEHLLPACPSTQVQRSNKCFLCIRRSCNGTMAEAWLRARLVSSACGMVCRSRANQAAHLIVACHYLAPPSVACTVCALFLLSSAEN